MERLTEMNENKTAHFYPQCFDNCGGTGYSRKCDSCDLLDRVCDKLGEYEDLEEQNKLLKLPCAVGDTVYCIYNRYAKCSESNQEFDEYNCQGCEAEECDSKKEYYAQEQKAYSLDWIVTQIVNKHFGKLVFLTKESAEAALKEMSE